MDPTGTELVIVKPKAPPLLAERTDFLEGDAPAAAKVETFLAQARAATGSGTPTAGALVPWICDVLLSNHSVKAYGRDRGQRRDRAGASSRRACSTSTRRAFRCAKPGLACRSS